MNSVQDILKKRAILAAKVEEVSSVEDGIWLLGFILGNEKYAIEVDMVSEVISSTLSLTQVPGTPSYIKGIFHIRGEFVSVVNLQEFLGIVNDDEEEANLFLLLNDENMEFAIKIQAIGEQFIVSRKNLQPIPIDFDFPRGDLILGMSEDGVIVLDGKKLIADPAMSIYMEV